jgi:hypothetical protein
VSQLSQYLLPEQAWAVIKDVIAGVKDSLPTEELRELIDAVEAYVNKVLNTNLKHHHIISPAQLYAFLKTHVFHMK